MSQDAPLCLAGLPPSPQPLLERCVRLRARVWLLHTYVRARVCVRVGWLKAAVCMVTARAPRRVSCDDEGESATLSLYHHQPPAGLRPARSPLVFIAGCQGKRKLGCSAVGHGGLQSKNLK